MGNTLSYKREPRPSFLYGLSWFLIELALYDIIPWFQKLYFRFLVCPGQKEPVKRWIFWYSLSLPWLHKRCHVTATYKLCSSSSCLHLSILFIKSVVVARLKSLGWQNISSFFACAKKGNGLLSQLKSLDAVLDHKMLLDLGPKQIAAYTGL